MVADCKVHPPSMDVLQESEVSATSTIQATARPLPITSARRRVRKLRETAFWYLLLAPSMVIVFGFSVVPMVWSIYYSLTKGGILSKHPFVGLQNYVKAAQHPIFLLTLQNTTLYAVMTIPIVIALAL